MSKRFTPWLVLACIGALAGCTSGSGDPAGNTELNVLIPSGSSQSGPGAPQAFDIQVVEYTINCSDGIDFDPTSDPDIDSGPILNNDVIISGVLEVLDTASGGVTTQDFGPDLGEVYVWQAFMDLPETVGCTVQLRARDGDGEVICTSTETFDIASDTLTKVNVLMFCDISYQAPVGMLDLDGDFSFNVSNYCPDLFILNCIDSELDVRTIPGFGDVLATACQVRFRDADSTCGNSCDPQVCSVDPQGLTCVPGPDPGVSTRVTCASTLGACAISCDGANPAAFCDFAGDTLGNVGDGPPGPLAPGIGGFFVTCATFDNDGDPNTPEVPVTPGDTIQCVATTTDGDDDCEKVKTVDLTIAGLSPCQTFGGDAACSDGNDCTDDVCVDATCDQTFPNCCSSTNSPAGQACTDAGGFPGTCDGAGLCVSTNCNAQPDPDGFCDDGDPCTAAGLPGSCLADGSCDSSAVNEGGVCDAGNGASSGTCQTGVCVDICTGVICDDGNECTDDPPCDSSTGSNACPPPVNDDTNTCTVCPSGVNCVCNAGVCEDPPTIVAGSGSTTEQAIPKIANTGTCVYDSVTTTCSGCVSSGVDAPGGGDCAAFGVQEFQGCEVPGGVLNSQLALSVAITLDIVSDGAGNITHDFTVVATAPALVPAAGLVTLDVATLFAAVTGGTPSPIQNDLAPPPIGGQLLGAYTGGTDTLILNGLPDGAGIEIPTVTTPVTPTVPSGGSVNFNYDNFTLTLTIQASGDPLVVDDAGCVFDVNGAGVTLGVL